MGGSDVFPRTPPSSLWPMTAQIPQGGCARGASGPCCPPWPSEVAGPLGLEEFGQCLPAEVGTRAEILCHPRGCTGREPRTVQTPAWHLPGVWSSRMWCCDVTSQPHLCERPGALRWGLGVWTAHRPLLPRRPGGSCSWRKAAPSQRGRCAHRHSWTWSQGSGEGRRGVDTGRLSWGCLFPRVPAGPFGWEQC